MAKFQSTLIEQASGKLGENIVMRQTATGKILCKAPKKASTPRRSEKQAYTRLQMANLLANYRLYSGKLAEAFENKNPGAHDANMFVSANWWHGPVYLTRQMRIQGACVLADDLFSIGSIEPIGYALNGEGKLVTNLNLGIEITATTTVAQFSGALLTANDNCKIAAMSLMSNPLMLALGFKDTKAELRDKVNAALKAMKEDNTLALLIVKYLNGPDFIMTKPIEFAKFDGAETIKVAVTGDLPPIDFIAPDGVPAGFNTAILAEIAKRLKVNLELVNIDTNARAAALASERADVVLWFKVYQGAENQPDIPAGVILSDPYYSWDKFMHIKLKDK